MGIFSSLRFHFFPWRNYQRFQHHTPAQRHEYMIGRLENARRREWLWVVVVAGIGFFTDAYAIFSVNMVNPILGYVYWEGEMPHSYEIALSIVTLGGVLFGQIFFGVAADIWGRRKMYGLELSILIFTTIGVALASSGAEESMSVLGLLLVWRFFLGLGLGGDYPLSAVICSEFAPTRIRGRMLAGVFFCQSLGQLAANLVSLITVAGFRPQLIAHATDGECIKPLCIRDVDMMWRLIVGLGAVPGFIALWFRLTIIESPRYTAEVTQNSVQAADDVSHFFQVDDETMPTDSHFELDRVTSADPSHLTVPSPSFAPSPFSQNPPPNEYSPPPDPLNFFAAFRDFARSPKVFRLLLATCLCWFCLDLPFYGLGLISPHIIETIWHGTPAPKLSVYDTLFMTSYQSMVVVSSGAVLGNLLAIFFIDRLGRRSIQLNGFFWLFVLSIVIGATFRPLVQNDHSSALVVMYILAQVFFNFGPNTTTYMIPAEVFPTRFRCTCHGLAAAFGKLGSIIAQFFFAYVTFGHDYSDVPNWLGYALLCLSIFMLIGLLLTYFLIPDVKDSEGRVKSLEQLAEDIFPLDPSPSERTHEHPTLNGHAEVESVSHRGLDD